MKAPIDSIKKKLGSFDLHKVRTGVTIQSKLLAMLLSVSLLSAAVIGFVGISSGRKALEQSAIDQLTSVRELKAAAIEKELSEIQSAVRMDSRTADAVEASADLNSAFDKLRTQDLDNKLATSLNSYYEERFIPELEARSGVSYEPESLFPNTEAGKYLQAHYTAPPASFDEALEVADAGDGSEWSKAHVKHHGYFTRLLEEHSYEDVLLLNTTGEVVYSAYKGTDLGVNVLAPPYADSQLSESYREVLRTNTVDSLITTDFERYIPSLNVPTAWIISPVGNNGEITGALAVQVPIESINKVMTGDSGWESEGLGESGEAYLVGEDGLMRSTSRKLVESPETYAKQAIEGGTPPETAERIAQVRGTILLQDVSTPSVQAALLGRTGQAISHDYLGRETLDAYRPIEVGGPRWVIVASVDTEEAFGPVSTLTRTVVLSTAALVLVIALLSLALARIFTRPLGQLIDGVKRMASGERSVEVDIRSKDEFSQLGSAFNEMSQSLQVKADLLDDQLAENDRLLLTLMPEKVARRYQQGEATIAEDHLDVTVVYADIVGFDELSHRMGSEESLSILNEIFASFDEAADRFGVERVRTTKQGYLASCGLVIPRVDSTRRTVDFVREINGILSRLNAQNGYSLSIRAGIDTGQVTSGLVGKSSVVFDMWGDAVNLAYQLQGAREGSGIYLTQRAAEKLPDESILTEPGKVQSGKESQTYWRVDTESSND